MDYILVNSPVHTKQHVRCLFGTNLTGEYDKTESEKTYQKQTWSELQIRVFSKLTQQKYPQPHKSKQTAQNFKDSTKKVDYYN